MKFNKENRRIAIYIFQNWIFYWTRILTHQPSSYLPKNETLNTNQHPLAPQDWIKVRKIVKGVNKLSPLLLKNRKCLMEALIVNETLRKEGINSLFHVGAKKKNQSIATHAWVSVQGRTVIGGPEQEFEELVKIPKTQK